MSTYLNPQGHNGKDVEDEGTAQDVVFGDDEAVHNDRLAQIVADDNPSIEAAPHVQRKEQHRDRVSDGHPVERVTEVYRDAPVVALNRELKQRKEGLQLLLVLIWSRGVSPRPCLQWNVIRSRHLRMTQASQRCNKGMNDPDQAK